jgi:hypothetical protein
LNEIDGVKERAVGWDEETLCKLFINMCTIVLFPVMQGFHQVLMYVNVPDNI